MTIAWIVLWLFSWLKQADPVCSPTNYYRNCWIRRFPGLYIAVEESERRGAALLQLYQEESALQCSRACCLAANCELLTLSLTAAAPQLILPSHSHMLLPRAAQPIIRFGGKNFFT